MRHHILTALICVGFCVPATAQIIPFDSDRWITEGATTVRMQFNGADALFLKGAAAVIEDDPIVDGEIEFDIAFSDQRGFSGVFWRLAENEDREEFYFRPHQSGFEDANQYNPVLNGVSGWQLYFGPSYSAPIRYKFNEWMHVRIVFSGSTADIYVDSEKPVLSVALKNPPISGRFGIYASNFAPAYFANFQYRKLEHPMRLGTPIPEPDAPPHAVSEWDLSGSFAETLLTGSELPSVLADTLSWMSVQTESTGILNLARYTEFGQGQNTALARTAISSDMEEVRTLRFGYSDRVAVYLNGHLIYRGNNNYRSRDYRYLGTIGLFDEVPLRLEAGENQLVFAVSESFGGWGLLATVE